MLQSRSHRLVSSSPVKQRLHPCYRTGRCRSGRPAVLGRPHGSDCRIAYPMEVAVGDAGGWGPSGGSDISKSEQVKQCMNLDHCLHWLHLEPTHPILHLSILAALGAHSPYTALSTMAALGAQPPYPTLSTLAALRAHSPGPAVEVTQEEPVAAKPLESTVLDSKVGGALRYESSATMDRPITWGG
jgi:hypothetical protein